MRIEAFDLRALFGFLASELTAMNERSKAYIARKSVENSATAMGSEANRNASGGIEKATVASRTSLANPSANDMKIVVGLTQSAIKPTIGEVIALDRAIPRMVEKSASPP